MICQQLKAATFTLGQLNPQPSVAEFTRIVCEHCENTVQCPAMTLDQAEAVSQARGTTPRAANGS